MRGQADLIAAVIMVSLAIVLALGVVYYLTPYVGRASVSQEVLSRLASISASVNPALTAYSPSPNGGSVVFNVYYAGSMPVTLFYTVLPVWNASPVSGSGFSFEAYVMEGSSAVISTDPVSAGWSPLPVFNASTDSVYVLVNGRYEPLSVIVKNVSLVKLYSDYLEPGASKIYLVDISYTKRPPLGFQIVVFAGVGREFYEVASLRLP